MIAPPATPVIAAGSKLCHQRHVRLTMLVVLVALLGCGRKSGSSSGGPPAKDVVAQVGDVAITAQDLERQLAAQPPQLRARWTTPQGKKEFLENLIRQALLANQAKARGLDKHPDVERVARQQMISLYVQQELEDKGKPGADVPDAEVEKYYKEHTNEFNRPDEVRVSQILVKDRGKAQRVAAEARKIPPADQHGFVQLVEKESEDPETRTRGGDLMFFDRNTARVPKEVVEAAFALKEAGDVSPPVKTDKGFHVLRLVQKRPGVTRSLDEAREEIRRRIHLMSRSRRMEELLKNLRATTKVEIHEDRLATVNPAATPPMHP
jgi:parvulin-like peptidyl-prolyl isomerase